jgi:hypothetical protein
MIIRKIITSLIPRYVQGASSSFEKKLVRHFADQDPVLKEEVQQQLALKSMTRRQPVFHPSPAVLPALQAKIAAMPVRSEAQLPFSTWALGMVMVFLALFIFIQTIPPGIQLKWSAQGEPLAGFRVYRAVEGTDQFELLTELKYSPDTSNYTFLDPMSLPGRQYTYRVDGLSLEGETIVRESLMANGADALLGQIVVLVTALLMMYGMVMLIRRIPFQRQRVPGMMVL